MLSIKILKDAEAKEKDGVELLMVKIEDKNNTHYEYGFVDELEAKSWINSMNLFELGF